MEIVTELGGLVNVGATTLLVFVVVLILTGRLMHRSTHEAITAALKEAIADHKESIAELRAQVKAQNETVNPALQRVLDSLPVRPEPPGKG